MRHIFQIGYNAVFFFALLLLLILTVFATYSENNLFLNVSQAIIIPFFLLAFFLKNKILDGIFVVFVICSFFGDASSLILGHSMESNSSNTMYFFSYIALIVVSISKFRLANIDKVIGLYLLGILLINGYFLFTLCNILSALISDGSEMILFGAKSMAVILLVFISFAVYLSTQTKASILFLIMAICFAFSDVLNYVVHYYIYNWSILMIDRLLHIAGLFFAFQYVHESHKTSEEIHLRKDIGEKTFSRDNILA